MYELIYGTLAEAEDGLCDVEYFDSEAEAEAFVQEEDPEVAELRYPDGSINVLRDVEED